MKLCFSPSKDNSFFFVIKEQKKYELAPSGHEVASMTSSRLSLIILQIS